MNNNNNICLTTTAATYFNGQCSRMSNRFAAETELPFDQLSCRICQSFNHDTVWEYVGGYKIRLTGNLMTTVLWLGYSKFNPCPVQYVTDLENFVEVCPQTFWVIIRHRPNLQGKTWYMTVVIFKNSLDMWIIHGLSEKFVEFPWAGPSFSVNWQNAFLFWQGLMQHFTTYLSLVIIDTLIKQITPTFGVCSCEMQCH